MRFHDRVLRNHGPGGDDGSFADLHVVQDHRSHADQAAIADRATVERHGVSYGNPVAHHHAVLVAHAVEHAAILDVRVLSDTNRVHVAADDRVHPHAGAFADLDVADDLRRLVHVARLVYARSNTLVRAQHKLKTLAGNKLSWRGCRASKE